MVSTPHFCMGIWGIQGEIYLSLHYVWMSRGNRSPGFVCYSLRHWHVNWKISKNQTCSHDDMTVTVLRRSIKNHRLAYRYSIEMSLYSSNYSSIDCICFKYPVSIYRSEANQPYAQPVYDSLWHQDLPPTRTILYYNLSRRLHVENFDGQQSLKCERGKA